MARGEEKDVCECERKDRLEGEEGRGGGGNTEARGIGYRKQSSPEHLPCRTQARDPYSWLSLCGVVCWSVTKNSDGLQLEWRHCRYSEWFGLVVNSFLSLGPVNQSKASNTSVRHNCIQNVG